MLTLVMVEIDMMMICGEIVLLCSGVLWVLNCNTNRHDDDGD